MRTFTHYGELHSALNLEADAPGAFRFLPKFLPACFQCAQCGAQKAFQLGGGTGYAVNKENDFVCYACCGANDKAEMIRDGVIVLYLDEAKRQVSNWPGTLVFPCGELSRSPRGGGFGGPRIDAWFTGPDGKRWHAIQRGHHNQIARCRRVKS